MGTIGTWAIFPAGQPQQLYHWIGGIGWGGQYLLVFQKLDLVIAMNCGNYHRSLAEQTAVVRRCGRRGAASLRLIAHFSGSQACATGGNFDHIAFWHL